MSNETLDLVRGALILVALLPVLYGIGRAIGAIQAAWSVHILAPLASVIGGTVDRSYPCIKGTYQGRDVRVSYTPAQSVGWGDSATSINAFHIEVTGLQGRHNWQVRFRVGGMFGQGAKWLQIEAKDGALGERLDRSGIAQEIAAVNAPTQPYVTVAYEAWRKTLTYTDDVAPGRIPSHDQFAAQLALVARLAKVNENVNPA